MSMEGEVTSGLLVTADMKPQYKFVEVLIRYPTSWRVGKHWVRSRFAETAAREAKVWLNSFGLLSSESRKKRIEAMNLVDYGGCPLPLGNYAATLLHTKVLSILTKLCSFANVWFVFSLLPFGCCGTMLLLRREIYQLPNNASKWFRFWEEDLCRWMPIHSLPLGIQ